MAKYFISWQADMSRFPADPKEQGKMVIGMAGKIKEMIAEGKTMDWGIFVGGGAGYSIREGDARELYKDLQKFSPYITFDVKEVLSVDDLIAAMKAMMG